MADKKVPGNKTAAPNILKAAPSKIVSAKSAVKTAAKAKPAAASAIAEQPAASRVKSVKHSIPAKAKTAEIPAVTAAASTVAVGPVDAQAEISRIAYGYWVARGYQGGNQAEDWFRAEAEFRHRTASV